MINILFCDDNTEFLSMLSGYVKNIIREKYASIFENAQLFSYDNGASVITFAERERIDIIFLDIDMKGMNGLDVAKKLVDINEETLIVFVSAYSQFVYDVFEFFPVAFLRKERVCDEISKVMKRLADAINEPNERLTITTANGNISVRKKEIVYIHSIGNYCYYVLTDGKQYSSRNTLNSIEKEITTSNFFRVHAAYIVNLDQIQRIDKSISVIMGKENVPIPIAQRRYLSFKRFYADFLSRRII